MSGMNRPINKTQMIVRQARADDAVEIARIYNHYVDSGGATFDAEHWTIEQTVKRLSQRRPDGWFIAADDDRTLGWASVRSYSDRFGYRFTCESAIYLDPSAIGLGVGDALQQRIEQHCVQCDIHHAVARIIADNARSMAFHRRYGYELVGIQKEVGRIDDQWVDVAILQKIF